MQSTRTTTLMFILFWLLPLECCPIQNPLRSVTWKPIWRYIHETSYKYHPTFLHEFLFFYLWIPMRMPLLNEKNPCSNAVWTLVFTYQYLEWALNCLYDIAQDSVVDNMQSTRTISLGFIFFAQLSTKCSKWAMLCIIMHHALNDNHYTTGPIIIKLHRNMLPKMNLIHNTHYHQGAWLITAKETLKSSPTKPPISRKLVMRLESLFKARKINIILCQPVGKHGYT